jgi:DNA helicase-2/ATP-dependent DNA helicase PcrA
MGGEQSETKIENLEELVNAAQSFEPNEQDELPPLEAFLAHAALESGEGQASEWEDCVQLMTMHSAKGLEFPLVFIVGMEEGLFPHQRSLNDPGGLEEERRLCYVGATRAMQQLYISHAEQRRLYGTDSYARASRFLKEIPADLIEEVRPKLKVSQTGLDRPTGMRVTKQSSTSGVQLGQRVRHTKFGEGVVLNYEGAGSHARVQVNFEAAGTKWLVMSYANLELM